MPSHLRLIRADLAGLEGQVKNLFFFAAEQRQHPMRRQSGEWLGEGEIVGELGPRLLLPGSHPRFQAAAGPHGVAKSANEVGVLGKTFDQDGPGALQNGRRVRHTPVRIDEGGRRDVWVDRRIAKQASGEGLESGLPGHLGLAVTLGLKGQIDVLKPYFGIGCHDPSPQSIVELALGHDRLQDRLTPRLQLSQVSQPFLQHAQLGVVEGARHLLAISGNEWNGGPAVEQINGRLDLPVTDSELVGDPRINGCGHSPDQPSPGRPGALDPTRAWATRP